MSMSERTNMDVGFSSLVLLIVSSCGWILVGGQTCSLSAGQFGIATITVNAESVDGSSPGVRVTWSTAIPSECVTSLRVDFRAQSEFGTPVATYNTTNTSQTEVIQTGLQCTTNYFISVVFTGLTSEGIRPTLSSSPFEVLIGDIPTPVGVRAEATADNTSIMVSWEWSRQDVPMCVGLVRVNYQPEGGSLMTYTVGSTTAMTNATLPNLPCNTEYTIWVYVVGGQTVRMSVPRMVYLPARAPPTPTEVSVHVINASSVRITWQWTSSGPPTDCFNTTTVTYHSEGGGESLLQLSDPAANETTLTDLQCSTNYTITVVATAGEHRREGVASILLQDTCSPVDVRAEATADNTSVTVSWEWPCQGLPLCVDLVRVDYQPEGGSLMMYTVSNTTATSATLPNLQCNTEYTIWVYARGGLNDTRSDPRMVFLPIRAPPTPTGVTFQVINASSVWVTWQWSSLGPPPDCFNTTHVTYRPEGDDEFSLQLSDPAATGVTLTDLRNNTNYTITVVATAGEYRRESMARTVLLPQQDTCLPVGVRAEATADNASIRVSWEWSHQGVSLCVDFIRVDYQPEGGSLMMYTVDNTTATSATLPNLQCNTGYTVWVYARSGQIDSRSTPRMVALPLRAPPTPTEVTAQVINASSIRVTWQWTSSGPPTDCFNTTSVTSHPEGGDESSLQLSDPAANETTLTDLQCNTNYTITVVATAGEYRREGVASIVLQGICSPVDVRAEATADNSSIRVSWEWPCQGLPLCVDLVRVDYQPTEGGSLMRHTVSNTTATSATLSNLQCNTEYTIWVYARGGQIDTRSTPRMVSLPARAPPTLTGVTAHIMDSSSVRIAWQWTSSGSAPDCFNATTVIYHPEGGDESSLQLSDPAANETTLTDLQCNTNYTITVVATAGEYRREGVVFFLLQGPPNVTVSVLSPTSVHLAWLSACNTQQYNIYYRGTCGTYLDEGRFSTDQQQRTFDGLQEGINYTFIVNQTEFGGGGVLSTGPMYITSFTAVPSGAPQSLEAMIVQPTEVSLRWREVACVQQNGPITGYVVRYYATCGADRHVQRNKSIVTAGGTIDGLTPNTEYAFQVAAINGNGTGPFSEPITLGGGPQLMVTPVNSTTVTVSWSEAQCFSGTVTHYLVQYQSLCSGAMQNVTTNGLIQTLNISGLIPNCVYTFRVAAVGEDQMVGSFSSPTNTSLPGAVAVRPEDQASTQCTSAWIVAGVAAAAVLVLLFMVVVESAFIWRLQRAPKILQTAPVESLSYINKGAEKIKETNLHDLPTQ